MAAVEGPVLADGPPVRLHRKGFGRGPHPPENFHVGVVVPLDDKEHEPAQNTVEEAEVTVRADLADGDAPGEDEQALAYRCTSGENCEHGRRPVDGRIPLRPVHADAGRGHLTERVRVEQPLDLGLRPPVRGSQLELEAVSLVRQDGVLNRCSDPMAVREMVGVDDVLGYRQGFTASDVHLALDIEELRGVKV